MNFKHDYLIFDEFGEKEILCMSCGIPIKSRAEIKSELDRKTIIRELSKHADYNEIPVLFSSGNICFVMVCGNCKFVDIGEEECASITNQIMNARRDQLKWKGLSQDIIDAIIDKFNFPVIRKAETHEVASAILNTV